MLITIDNYDGRGPLDYTGAVTPEGPITVQRALNKPSRCMAEIVVGAGGLALPSRRAFVSVTAGNGTVLFTGYLATEPVRTFAGEGTMGAVYRARISAVSEEWLLDGLGSGSAGSGGSAYEAMSLQLDGEALLSRLVERVPGTSLAVSAGTGTLLTTGAFTPEATQPWSKNAGAAASAAYAGYRALGGQVVAQPAGAVVHRFSEADGTLSVAELQLSALRELANDVTLSGEEEPAAFIEEVFVGDGTTTVFDLSETAFRGAQRTLLRDSFNGPGFDLSQWNVSDPGSHLSLTSAGLTMNGGNGQDGATTLAALDTVEMGGAIVAELGGVQLAAGSDGMLSGFYQGAAVLANCFAGFRVRQSAGSTVMIPVVNGVETGSIFSPIAGHRYTLRLRLHCVEMQRVMQRYYCMVDGVVQSFGSAIGVAAPMDVVFELVDEGTASNTPATVLYDSIAVGGTLNVTPAACEFVAVNATQIFGSVASVTMTRPGSLWVVSTLPSGVQQTRLIGVAGQGADCTATYGTANGSNGKVTFFAGRVPVAGERVTVSYRGQKRSVTRLADAASLAAATTTGQPGTSRWLGKVLQPAARSSVDCESAAQAVLAVSTSRSAALSGSYTIANPVQDIWPGDVLAITSDGVTSSLLVREVSARDGHGVPEIVEYAMKLANDWAAQWADGIGLRLSEAIATDAFLPAVAETSPGQVLANLQQVTVTSLNATTLALDMGADPPAGGGFEVRRTDWQFGAGVDTADLVLRSPVRSFSIPRAAQVEQFYLRMYDASTPERYSRFSSAVVVNAPVG